MPRIPIRMLLALALALSISEPIQAQTDESEDEVAQNEPAARLDILEFQVEGNTVLPTINIERAVYPFLGPDRTFAEVEQARVALEKAYQQAGYLTVLVDIPEQKVQNGVITLRVVEGAVARYRVTGNRYYSAGEIRKRVSELAEGNVPDFNEVQSQIGTLARAQDRKIIPVLRPGPTPGTVEAELKVEDKSPLHGSIELNNRQTPNTEPLRLSTFLRYDNLWQREHSASILFLTAPEDRSEIRVFSGTYVMPVNRSGDSLAFYTVTSNSSVTAVGSTNVIGKGSISGVRYILSLPPRGTYYHTLSFGIDSKDFKESQRLGSDTTETPISYVPMNAEYRVTIPGQRRTHSGSIGLYTALRSFFGNNEEEFARKRFGAKPNYLYARGDWLTEHRFNAVSSVRARFIGQLSDQPLISNEQFAAGGAETVRGYLEIERLGDQGLIGSLEARRVLLIPGIERWGRATALAFADGARLRVLNPLPGQQSSFELLSAGLGLRLDGSKYWTMAVDLAYPFTDAQVTRKGDTRAHFRVEGHF